MGLALLPEKIISEFQAQNPKLMKHRIINAFLITFLADFIKYTRAKITAKFDILHKQRQWIPIAMSTHCLF
ncbi:hypothetical protein QA584_18205 [Anaerocolumna sp. AGMB13025]|uniref:hypothetical protein n=1 Tax=Anaerocolumna sp. AGMB13025 TaxID=3039116 RepID=UPI00241F9D71|nr:hypothetical protein [Anaerocolumna sp. AGMB13025]WFR55531.1 hypothetical protein QA584_18205 [Anaerocolumna sp. AGMB13025]